MREQLIGTWLLESLTLQSPDGQTRPWGTGLQGLLIYTESGEVSVAINRKPASDSAQDILDSLLFYAGTFSVDGSTVRHHVTLASNPARIGQEMVRQAKLEYPLLTLTAADETGGNATVVWRKR